MPMSNEVTPGHNRFREVASAGETGVELKGARCWPEYRLASQEPGDGCETLGVPRDRVGEAGLFEVGPE